MYSPKTGETVLTNDVSAAILELLAEGPATVDEVAAQLADDAQAHAEDTRRAVLAGWPGLVEAGLIEADVAPAQREGS